MNKVIGYFKKHELLAVTAICVAVVCLLGIATLLSSLTPIPTPIDDMTDAQVAKATEGCPVDFADDRFLLAVSRSLNCSVEKLTQEKMAQVQSLLIQDIHSLKTIEDIVWFPNLISVTVKNCDIFSVDVLAQVKNLESVTVSGTQIQQIAALSSLTHLHTLDVSNNRLDNLNGFRSDSLTNLIAVENKITDITPILDLESLIEADFSDNLIEQIPNLSQAKKLTKLSLAGNRISALSFAKDSNLLSLNISYCQILDLSPLSECRTLEELYLYGYRDMDLSPLHDLPNFCSLFLSQSFDRSQVEFLIGEFKQADRYTKVYLVAQDRGLEIHE